MRLITNAGLDVVDHVFADDRFAMRIPHVLDGATNHLGIVFCVGVPGAARHQRATFEQSHIFLLIFNAVTILHVEGHEG